MESLQSAAACVERRLGGGMGLAIEMLRYAKAAPIQQRNASFP
jgi:hypothetical protein